jgi:hypothetical protein
MERIELGKVRQGFRGRPLYKLVEYHLSHQKQDVRIHGILGTIEMLPGEAKPLVDSFIDRWNRRVYEKDFWQMDVAVVFDEIIEDARSILHKSRISFDDETLFNMFNIIVLSYAYSAYDQPKMREFMGIRSHKCRERRKRIAIGDVLKKWNKNSAEEVYWELIMAGAGEDIARRVTSDKDLLDKYLQLRNQLREKGASRKDELLKSAFDIQELIAKGQINSREKRRL